MTRSSIFSVSGARISLGTTRPTRKAPKMAWLRARRAARRRARRREEGGEGDRAQGQFVLGKGERARGGREQDAHADAVRDPRARQDEEEDERRHALARPMLAKAPRLAPDELEERPAEEPQGERPPDRGQDDVQDDEARRRVDEGDGEREEDPADDVAASAQRESESVSWPSSTTTTRPPRRTLSDKAARRVHRRRATHLPTPAERTMTPTWSLSRFSSVKMRAKTGKAVMALAVPMNKRNVPKSTVPASTKRS